MSDSQIELEELFAKNHLMSRLRQEFHVEELVAHCAEHELPVSFTVDLLAQLVLHRRASMSVLVGILSSHFGTSLEQLQACADMIQKATIAGLVEFDQFSSEFVIKFDIPEDTKIDLERFQYPLPMIVPPKEVRTNHDTGYFTIQGSLLLKHNHHDDDICLDHINRVNQIPLVINPDTARMVKNSWKDLDRCKPGESKKDYQARVKAFAKYDAVSRDVIDTIYMTGEPFYITNRYDKRGRCYAQGYHVNPQGNPWNKAVIEFAQQELVT